MPRRWLNLAGELSADEEREQLEVRETRRALAIVDRERGVIDEYDRPTTLNDCDRARPYGEPCPWLSCKFHTGIHVTATGRLYVKPGWDEGGPTCVLDLADREHSLPEVSAELGITSERVRQIEIKALHQIRRQAREARDGES
jgi:hypothetical protein